MRYLKGSAMLFCVAMSSGAFAAEFETRIISWNGPWEFTAFSEFADPAINHISANQRLKAEGPNATKQFTVVSEAHCTPGWWLTGQSVMTIDGSLRWNSYWDPMQFLRIETTMLDLDSGRQYFAESGFYSDGRSFGGAIRFNGATKNVRFTDVFTLSTGPDGVFSEWVSANHFMTASQTVPEPGSLAMLAISGLALVRRRRKHQPC